MEHVPIEHLSKQQIVLLTLFVAFVSSIATGITVVALLDQSPQAVTQGINQVVERTIEKVIPVETPATTDSDTQVQQAVTVQVGQDDLAAAAISQGIKSVARLYNVVSGQKTFVGMGIVIDATGTIATDKALFSPDQTYVAVVDGGPDIYLSSTPLVSSVDTKGIGFFSPINGVPQGTTVVAASLATGTPNLGQTIVALVGESKDTVEQGIVSSLDTGTDSTVNGIETTLDETALIDGSAIVTLDGKIAGLTITSSGNAKSVYIPAPFISKIYSAK